MLQYPRRLYVPERTSNCKASLIVRFPAVLPHNLQNNLGGGEGIEGLYGSVKGGGVQKIFDCMRDHCDFGADSHLVDIGAGLGR